LEFSASVGFIGKELKHSTSDYARCKVGKCWYWILWTSNSTWVLLLTVSTTWIVSSGGHCSIDRSIVTC